MRSYYITSCGQQHLREVSDERYAYLKSVCDREAVRELNPADFLAAFKLGLVEAAKWGFETKPGQEAKPANSNKEKVAYIKANASRSVRELVAATGFSSTYVSKLKRRFS